MELLLPMCDAIEVVLEEIDDCNIDFFLKWPSIPPVIGQGRKCFIFSILF